MFSLASSAGTPAQAQAQTAFDAARSTSRDPAGKFVPVLNSAQAAERVLRSAVEAIRSSESEAELARRDELEQRSEALEREERRTTPREEHLGSQLDVTV